MFFIHSFTQENPGQHMKKSVCSVDVDISLDENWKKKKNIILKMALLSSSVFAWFTQTAETHTHKLLKTRERFPCFSCFLMHP